MRRLISAIEASYASVGSGNVDRWLCTTVRALAPVFERSRGIMGYTFDARGHPARWSVSRPFVHDGPTEMALATVKLFEVAPPIFRRRLYRAERRAHTLSELNGFTIDALPFGDAATIVRRTKIVDFIGLNACNPDGLGAMFASASEKRRSLRAAERLALSRLAGHLAACNRLVRAMESLAPAAVLAPDGRIVDLSRGSEKDATPLGAAVLAMDRARGPLGRKDPSEALDLWRALVLGRYSLVDRYERDGRRFVVAYENSPGLLDPRALTGRESAVAGLLALALPDKQIAYELGISEGTVRAHVHAILVKLGVSSRALAIDRLAPDVTACELEIGERGPKLVVFEQRSRRSERVLAVLTTAEREVVELLARGMSTAAVARVRRRSVATVARQIASAYAKLGVRSRAELVQRIRG
jgi:DNA-binding NarL/FixJ family response regulator